MMKKTKTTTTTTILKTSPNIIQSDPATRTNVSMSVSWSLLSLAQERLRTAASTAATRRQSGRLRGVVKGGGEGRQFIREQLRWGSWAGNDDVFFFFFFKQRLAVQVSPIKKKNLECVHCPPLFNASFRVRNASHPFGCAVAQPG